MIRGRCFGMLVAATSLWIVPHSADAARSRIDELPDGVLAARDDSGTWGGPTVGITHQSGPHYWAKKVLDLTGVSQQQWNDTKEVRLSAYFCVRDYSEHATGTLNGLDETLVLVVNGHEHRVATGDDLPAFENGKPWSQFMRWHDFPVPREQLVRGPNEIVLRMAPPEGKRGDDYLYLGIDNSTSAGNSYVRFGDGAAWRQDKLTVPGGAGEYMVRLYLITRDRHVVARWTPTDGRLDDPRGLIAYAGSHGPTTRVEWDPRRIDRLGDVTVRIETGGDAPFHLTWLDDIGKPFAPADATGPAYESTRSGPLLPVPSGIEIPKDVDLRSATVTASLNYHAVPPPIDIAPRMQPPAGKPAERAAECRIDGDRITLANDNLRATFSNVDGHLRLDSLYNELTASETVRSSQDVALWMVEMDGKRYAGSQDFTVRSVAPLDEGTGFTTTCVCEPIGLEATFVATIDHVLQLNLSVTNRAEGPRDFKVAFPHFAGLAISDNPADDYYFYPMSLLVGDWPAIIRKGYGDHQALYQLMDLFSPARGGGLAVCCTDNDGRYKVLALRKYIPAEQEHNEDHPTTPTSDEYKWTNSLPAVPGIGLAYEYLRRTRGPGESFATKPVALRAHAGDWRVPMRDYARWCHDVWKFRPSASRLAPVWNMVAAGWGKAPIFRDGKYRTNLVRPEADCIELMSWWEWSDAGPGGFPLDQLEEKLGAAKAERWQSYLVEDGATGRLMFSNNPGDYDGYNERWGGLPALRDTIAAYRDQDMLVTLYTDPFRVDRATKCGRQHGGQWGVVRPDGTYRDDYDAWRMCHDTPAYRQWVAEQMQRVLRETGADGIRLDEYGHAGSACFSTKHEHTYAEPGCTEWQRGVAEATRLIRAAMDEVDPRTVLTTEHPGYDFLMPHIEGCITYDLTVLGSGLRPVEINLQRFYFPECLAYELDHRGADPQHHKRFFNAVRSFGAYFPAQYAAVLRQHAATFNSGHCEPLIPTLAKYVYANQFDRENEVVYTLYNGTGHSFHGDVLTLEVRPGDRVVDLLRDEAADVQQEGDKVTVRVFLERDDVGCVAVVAENAGS